MNKPILSKKAIYGDKIQPIKASLGIKKTALTSEWPNRGVSIIVTLLRGGRVIINYVLLKKIK